MEFDGSRWRLLLVENRSTVRSIAINEAGRIYVGAQQEFGYFEANEQDRLEYHSLASKLPEHQQDFQDVWEVILRPEGVYFTTLDRIFLWDGEEFESWEPDATYHRTFDLGERILVREREAGLKELKDGELRLLPGGERFADIRVDMIFPAEEAGIEGVQDPDRELLVGTRTEGILYFTGEEWREWPTAIDEELARDRLYSAAILPDGRIALGTTRGGVYLMTPEGDFAGRLDRLAGLQDDIVYELMVDREGGLWMALDGGLARANADAAFSQYDGRRGLPGRINYLERHEGSLYASTNQGLFVLKEGKPAAFEAVEGVPPQAWELVPSEGGVLVASNAGVFLASGPEAELVRESQRTSFSLLASEYHPGRYYIGLSNGVAVIERTEDGWRDHGRVDGVTAQIRAMAENDDGSIWLSSAHTGVVRMALKDLDSMEPEVLERFGTEAGLPDPQRNFVYDVAGQRLFGTRDGLMRFDPSAGEFEFHPEFEGLFPDENRRLLRLEEDPSGRIWMHARDEARGNMETGVATPDGEGGYRWDGRVLRGIQGIYTYGIHADSADVVWFGGDEGLFRVEPQRTQERGQPFRSLIRRVETLGGDHRFDGGLSARRPQLPYSENRLRFDYAGVSFQAPTGMQYQVKLEGQDEDWSYWMDEASETRGNLWEGEYRFRVRARNLYGVVGEEAVFDFEILPPWYRTYWAYALYAVSLVLVAWLLLQWWSRRLSARNRKLQDLVRERTADLEEEKNRAEHTLERLRDTQYELVEAEKMATVGRLVSGIAHEINTPVGNGQITATSLAEQAEILGRSLEEDRGLSRKKLSAFFRDCLKGLTLMSSSFERIGALVGRLHRMASDPNDFGVEWFELSDLFRDVALTRQDQANERNVTIRAEAAPYLSMKGNRVALSECLHELVDNSLDHGFPDAGIAGQSGEIGMGAREEDGEIILEYRDDGRGVPAELREAIFEPFAAGSRSEARHTGLGMHTVFNTVKRVLGGSIEYLPRASGVCFTIRLPREIEAGE